MPHEGGVGTHGSGTRVLGLYGKRMESHGLCGRIMSAMGGAIVGR